MSERKPMNSYPKNRRELKNPLHMNEIERKTEELFHGDVCKNQTAAGFYKGLDKTTEFGTPRLPAEQLKQRNSNT